MTRQHTRADRERNARILAATDVCHLCGHPGADAVDHVLAWSECTRRGLNPDAPQNLKPAHHRAPCPTCGIRCNLVKSDKPMAPIIRRSGSLSRPS